MMSTKETFGAFVRREREARQIGLRKMAKLVGMSPAYLSMIERDEVPPPAEEKLRRIAEVIQFDPDRLLSLANRVSSEILEALKRHPSELSSAIRKTAEVVQFDPDRMKAVADRLSSGMLEVLKRDPSEVLGEIDKITEDLVDKVWSEIVNIAKTANTTEMRIVSEDEDYMTLENEDIILRLKKRKPTEPISSKNKKMD